MRSVELDLRGRPGLTHAILPPAWFMQNFSETFLKHTRSELVDLRGASHQGGVDSEPR